MNPVTTTGSISHGLTSICGPECSYIWASCCNFAIISGLGPRMWCCAASYPRLAKWPRICPCTPDIVVVVRQSGSVGGWYEEK